MPFSAGTKTAPKGQNVGERMRGRVWSPVYRMEMRAVNRVRSDRSTDNEPLSQIQGRTARKSRMSSGA